MLLLHIHALLCWTVVFCDIPGIPHISLAPSGVLVDGALVPVRAFSYSPTPIGCDSEYDTTFFGSFFKPIHLRDLGRIAEFKVNTLFLPGYGMDKDHSHFQKLLEAQEPPLWAIPEFSLARYHLSQPNLDWRLVTQDIVDDFKSFVEFHRSSHSTLMYSVGDLMEIFNPTLDSDRTRVDEFFGGIMPALLEVRDKAENASSRHPLLVSIFGNYDGNMLMKALQNTAPNDGWLVSMQGQTIMGIGDWLEQYDLRNRTKALFVAIGVSAWNYAQGSENEETQARDLGEIVMFVDPARHPFVAGNIVLEFSDQWWRASFSGQLITDCDDNRPFIHSPCGWIPSSGGQQQPGFNVPFVSSEYFGLFSQVNFLGQHCVRPRVAAETLKDIWINVTASNSSKSLVSLSTQLLSASSTTLALTVSLQNLFGPSVFCTVLYPDVPFALSWDIFGGILLLIVVFGSISCCSARRRRLREKENALRAVVDFSDESAEAKAGKGDASPSPVVSFSLSASVPLNPLTSRDSPTLFEFEAVFTEAEASLFKISKASEVRVILECHSQLQRHRLDQMLEREKDAVMKEGVDRERVDKVAMEIVHLRALEGVRCFQADIQKYQEPSGTTRVFAVFSVILVFCFCVAARAFTSLYYAGLGAAAVSLLFSVICFIVCQAKRRGDSACNGELEGDGDLPFNARYSRVLAFNILASISEAMVHCPEKLSHLFTIGWRTEADKCIFRVEMRALFAGLSKMGASMEGNNQVENDGINGINFEDVNDAALWQIPLDVNGDPVKTWQEPDGIAVLFDILVIYHPILLMHWWIFVGAYFVKKGIDIGVIGTFAQIDAIVFTAVKAMSALWFLFRDIHQREVSSLWRACSHMFAAAGGWCLLCGASGLTMLPAWVVPAVYGALRLTHFIFSVVLDGGALFTSGTTNIFDPTSAQKKIERSKKTRDPENSSLFKNILYVGIVLASNVVLSIYLVVPMADGISVSAVCSELTTDGMSSCSAYGCVVFVWGIYLLIAMTTLMNTFFIFNIAVGPWGYIEGTIRGMRNVRSRGAGLTFDKKDYEIINKNGSVVKIPKANPYHVRLLSDIYGDSPGVGPHSDLALWERVWVAIIKEMWERDIISLKDKQTLSKRQGAPHVDQLACSAAREQLSFFLASLDGLKNDLRRGTLGNFSQTDTPSLTHVVAVYGEDIVRSLAKLRESNVDPGNKNAENNLDFIISQHKNEWVWFVERMKRKHAKKGFLGPITPELADIIDDASGRDLQNFLRRCEENEATSEIIWQVRLWASYRSQTVARTLRGPLSHWVALSVLLRPEMASKLCQVVVSHQQYGTVLPANEQRRHAEQMRDLNRLMKSMAQTGLSLMVAMDYKHEPPKQTDDPVFGAFRTELIQLPRSHPVAASLLPNVATWTLYTTFDLEANKLRVDFAIPRAWPIRIGNKEQTQGKAGNQDQALRCCHGHVVQLHDANMDGCIAECFKIPFITRQFSSTAPIPPVREGIPDPQHAISRAVVRKRSHILFRIIGFREHIFTGEDGIVGRCTANMEFAFGTIFQRVMSTLGVRMHYGHPDFFDGFWAFNRGSFSKASKKLCLSEDVFAGFNVYMRGEKITHDDRVEWQKGRETSMLSATALFAKFAEGTVAVLRSRDHYRIQKDRNIFHQFSLFYGTIGSYLNQLMIYYSIEVYMIAMLTGTIAGVTVHELGVFHNTLGAEWLVSAGVVTALPLLCELMLEHGAAAGLIEFCSSVIPTSVFFMFQNRTIAAYMESGILTGKSLYRATGRPDPNTRYSMRETYLSVAQTHFYPALRIVMLYLLYDGFVLSISGGRLPMYLIIALSFIWICGPIIFCPNPTWPNVKKDILEFVFFLPSDEVYDLWFQADATMFGAAICKDCVKLPPSGRDGWPGPYHCTHSTIFPKWQTWMFLSRIFMSLLTTAFILVVSYSMIWAYLYVFICLWILHVALTMCRSALASGSLESPAMSLLWLILPWLVLYPTIGPILIPTLDPFSAASLLAAVAFFSMLQTLYAISAPFVILLGRIRYRDPRARNVAKLRWARSCFELFLQYHLHALSAVVLFFAMSGAQIAMMILFVLFRLLTSVPAEVESRAKDVFERRDRPAKERVSGEELESDVDRFRGNGNYQMIGDSGSRGGDVETGRNAKYRRNFDDGKPAPNGFHRNVVNYQRGRDEGPSRSAVRQPTSQTASAEPPRTSHNDSWNVDDIVVNHDQNY